MIFDFSLFILIPTGYFYFFKDWFWLIFPLFLIVSLPQPFIAWIYLPESPKLLIEKSQYDEAWQVLWKIASYSKINFPNVTFKLEQQAKETSHDFETLTNDDNHLNVQVYTTDFLKIGFVLTNFLICIYLFGTISFNNYMMGYYLKYIGGNIFLNWTIKGVSQGIAVIFGSTAEKLFNAWIAFSLSFFVACLAGIPFFFMDPQNPSNKYYVMTSVAFQSFGVISAMTLIYMIHPILFPSLFVGTSMASSNIFARVLSILSSQIAEFK